MPPTFFRTSSDFRKWLQKNHNRMQELLLGFHRVDSGKGGITYREALDEALCFGWIDGLRKRYEAPATPFDLRRAYRAASGASSIPRE